ncbi:MAG: iron ABC transporter permease [Armatimonadota bacterium]|nr:iron ABC transporter permease [Armatimonadota bacterium]MDR5702869.1 iron ABC transporter permease [Armatimonadota bacterium]
MEVAAIIHRAERAGVVDRLVQGLVALVTIFLVALPLVPILYQSFLSSPLYEPSRALTLSNYIRLLENPEFRKVLSNTLVFAIATTALGVVLGTILAILIMRTDMPGRTYLSGLVISPLFLSPLVIAFAWTVIFGPQGYLTQLFRSLADRDPWNLYSLGGMAILGGVYYAPYTYLYASGSLALSDPSVEDAARIAGAGPLRTLWRVTLPLLRPALLYSGLLTFIAAAEVLSIPLVLGTPVGIELFSSFLYKLGIVGGTTEYGMIAAASVLVLVFLTLLIALQERLLGGRRRFVTVTGRATRARLLSLGRIRWAAAAWCWLYVFLAIILPLVGIVAQSFTAFLSPFMNPLEVMTLDHYRLIFGHSAYARSILNSFLIAFAGGAVGILFMALVTLVAFRSDFPLRRLLIYVALYPRAIPGIIVGIGFLWTFLLLPGLGALRNTILGLTLAFITRYIPYGFGAVSPAVFRVSEEMDRAARVVGASWITTIRKVLLPLLREALFGGYALLFITFLKEYASAVFLFARGSEVMGTTMIELWRQGDSGPVSALAVVQVVLTLLWLGIARGVLGVKVYG